MGTRHSFAYKWSIADAKVQKSAWHPLLSSVHWWS